MCLNVFLVVQDPHDAHRVLLGKVAPDSRWMDVGGLGPERVARVADRWMLPSRQLLLFEPPDAAARLVAEEQLGLALEPLPVPQVVSETYALPGSTVTDPHWDLHFIYRTIGPAVAPRNSLWDDLAYAPIGSTSRRQIARGHGDILEFAGFTPAP
jgi:hypothetical protein